MPPVKSTVTQDSQNLKINIEKIYKDFFNPTSGYGIDSIRSNINITNSDNAILLASLKEENFKGASLDTEDKKLKVEKTLQESRCHAFYRLIGFPVVSKNNGIYNPGHDIIYPENENDKKTITDKKRAEIAKSPLDKFYTISEERESYYRQMLDIFNINDSIEAGVLSLSSVNFRKFSDCIKNTDFTNKNIYNISTDGLVGVNKVPLSDYVDVNNNKPGDKFLKNELINRRHIILPFIVDPRIDISCPGDKRVAVPFVPDDTKLKTSQSKLTIRPGIEYIIRDRFSLGNQQTKSGSYLQSAFDAIKQIKAIKDEQIINDIMSGNVYGILEKQKFIYFLNIIRAMVVELNTAIKGIKSIQGSYYWLPKPDKMGPENGFSIRQVFKSIYTEEALKPLNTEKDFELIYAIQTAELTKLKGDSILKENVGVPDVGKYALSSVFSTFSPVVNPSTSAGVKDVRQDQVQKLSESRKAELEKAGNFLKKVEMIMGEFSGFGLCDAVAILAALYTMPSESLLGFLDDDAYERAKKDKNLKGQLPSSKPSFDTASNDLIKNIKSFYDIMDKVTDDYFNRNKVQ